MENIVPLKIQIISIAVTISFMIYVFWLIAKGKLREEYSIIWVVSALILLVFSIWRNGLAVIASLLGVYNPPNIMFMMAFFAVFLYLLHLAVTVSKLQENNKALAQKIAMMEKEREEIKTSNTEKKS
jgi:hypothetical protein